MARVFYGQKTEQLVEKVLLAGWRRRVSGELTRDHQDMSDNWKMCAIGERVMLEGRDMESVRDLSPEAIKLGYDFSVALQERDNERALEIIAGIEGLPTIWRDGHG